jgi:hypothetical protein
MTDQLLTRDQRATAAGVAMTGGAVVLLAGNVLFPRAEDAWDVAGVLTMMADGRALRQVSFLLVTGGLWVATAGLVAIDRRLADGPAGLWARWGRSLAVVGVTLFTAASALGLAATGAAVTWVVAGADPTGADYAVAAALNLADDAVWYLSIVAYWSALALYGLAMVRSERVPTWLGWWGVGVGVATAVAVGVPLAVGVESMGLLLAFGVLATLSTLWLLALGIWALRGARTW